MKFSIIYLIFAIFFIGCLASGQKYAKVKLIENNITIRIGIDSTKKVGDTLWFNYCYFDERWEVVDLSYYEGDLGKLRRGVIEGWIPKK